MEVLAAYKVGITVLVPVFSAITCFVLVALSRRDCVSQEERRLKKVMQVYLALSALGWYMTFCYVFHPELFTWIQVLCLLSYVLPSIFFYRIVRYFTRLGSEERFSRLHYLLPAVLAAVLMGWSLFVPIEVQMEIVKGKAMVFPPGYELYARFFTMKPLLRVVFGMAYYILTIAVLVNYYKATNGKQTRIRRTAGWVIFLVGLSIGSLLSSLLPTFMPRTTLLQSLWTMLAAGAMAFQHVLLAYHIIRRKYWLYTALGNSPGKSKGKSKGKSVEDAVASLEAALNGEGVEEDAPKATSKATSEAGSEVVPNAASQAVSDATSKAASDAASKAKAEDDSAPSDSESELKPQRRKHSGMLERKHFEQYFREAKPWLNPDCKITDMVEVFDVNRTAISNFINRTYGMNFNRYLNNCRMKELERLRALPANRDKSVRSLVEKAGFYNYRAYLRAVAAEQEAQGKESEEEQELKDKEGGTA